MISYIKGELSYIDNSKIIVENNGIGYEINISAITSFAGIQTGMSVKVYTYMAVREDDISLYGFLTQDELTLFKLLITVSGVGPKAALAILAELGADNLRIAICAEDDKAIAKAKGVGAKSAKKVIVELKDKIDIAGVLSAGEENVIIGKNSNPGLSASRAEVIEALVALGVSDSIAFRASGQVENAEALSTEEYLKQALKFVSF